MIFQCGGKGGKSGIYEFTGFTNSQNYGFTNFCEFGGGRGYCIEMACLGCMTKYLCNFLLVIECPDQ